MTKRQAIQGFRETFLPAIRKIEKENGSGVDAIMRREAWSNYTDLLREEKQITRAQDATWTNPF